jgi:hypothetical protein
MGMSTYQGKPGRKLRSRRNTAAMRYGRDWLENCFVMSLPKDESEMARVTMMPVAVEISSAGSCVTRPSPIEREI